LRNTDPSLLSRLTDEELLGIYRERQEPELVGILFRRYTHLVFANCLKHLGDAEAARDAVMGIFEGLFDSLSYTDVRHFSSWLYTVSRNYCLIELRRAKSEAGALHGLFLESEGSFMENPEDLHLKEALHSDHDALHRAMGQLGEEQRVCVGMMYLEGRSYKEIAEHTGYGINKVKSHIQNGKRNLRLMLGRSAPLLLWLLIH